mmetsp:Transcript_4623/g.10031  ORF Transcript_4623/g.10031 Transcript_4623/m.10031 type:complete len:276 (-) Transcript_4623:429-1256(-)
MNRTKEISKPWMSTTALLYTLSVGDWLSTLLVLAIGLYLDKQPSFERDIRPQLHDPAISYPHTPHHLQQVTTRGLWMLSAGLPFAAIVCTQLCRRCMHDLNQALLGLSSSLALALMLVCVVKNAVGRLRPDFLARCVPVDGECTGDLADVLEGRKSFPSGHTSLSFAGLAYLSWYLLGKLWMCRSLRWSGHLWRLLFCTSPCVLALWVGLSRIEDYWHHWEDVMVGCFLGNLCAFGMYFMRYPPTKQGGEPLVLRDMTGKRSPPEEDDPERNPFV